MREIHIKVLRTGFQVKVTEDNKKAWTQPLFRTKEELFRYLDNKIPGPPVLEYED